MISVQKIIVGLVSGILLGVGIWAFFDGVVYSKDKFPWVHILPLLASITAFLCINFVTFEQMKAQGIVKVWVFFFMTLGFVAIGIAIWITATEYPPEIESNWPGVAIIVQTTLTLFAALLFFAGRSNLTSTNKHNSF